MTKHQNYFLSSKGNWQESSYSNFKTFQKFNKLFKHTKNKKITYTIYVYKDISMKFRNRYKSKPLINFTGLFWK